MKAIARYDFSTSLNLPARFGGDAIAACAGLPCGVRIHVTHPSPILRIGMATVLAAQPGFDVVDTAMYFPAADAASIVITDYAAGMQLIGQLGRVRPGLSPKVLIVTNREKEWEVRQAIESGVHGYLLQNCVPDELIRSVQLLSRGMGYLSSNLKRSVAASLRRESLTPRENEVLRLLAGGDSNKTIADELGIGIVTVKTHVGQLMQKLDATTRTHAVAIALRRGLLPSGADGVAPRELLEQ